LANLHLALAQGLKIIPVINKIDSPNADIDKVLGQLEELDGLDTSLTVQISAKTGLNVDQVLDQIVAHIPSPNGDREQPLQALVFDSHYDEYQGIMLNVRVVNGQVNPGQQLHFVTSKYLEKHNLS
jgi:GTP-binding protein LepA